jgi:hypothetical protein
MLVLFTNERVRAVCLSTVTGALDTRFRTVPWSIPIVFHTYVNGPLASLLVVVTI